MKRVSTVISILLCILISALCIYKLDSLLERKSATEKYHSFFEEEEDFDVLFIGNSHMLNAIYPMELWHDYGITSYNMGGHSNTPATSYWVLKNALDYTKPKLVVFDCYLCQWSGMVSAEHPEMLHLSMDAFPLTKTKIEGIKELLPSNRDRMEYLFDLSIYHNRWKELTQDDFIINANVEKGATFMTNVAIPNNFDPIDSSLIFEGESGGIQYIRKAIEDCQAQGIDVLLTFFPAPYDADNQAVSNRIKLLAKEYGINSINCNDFLPYVDFDTDCADSYSHLNASGAQKMTSYVGKFIRENYSIPEHISTELCTKWDNDYEVYLDFKNTNVLSQKSINSELMLLADDSYDYVIWLKNPKSFIEDSVHSHLLTNIGIDVNLLQISAPLLIYHNGADNDLSIKFVGDELEVNQHTYKCQNNGLICDGQLISDSLDLSDDFVSVSIMNNLGNNALVINRSFLDGEFVE